jgi:thiosulfate/3-mercaptopyruvate sulfurtransferase
MTFNTLVSTLELAARLDQPSLVVVDCRHDLARPGWGREEYARAHIPGARFMHLDEDLSSQPDGRNGRHPLPEPPSFARTLGRAGIAGTTQVVAYDSQGGMVASRLWWMLRHWLGHEAVAVLDGGWDAWLAEGRPVSADVPRNPPASYAAGSGANAVDSGYVLSRLGQPGMVLLDARAPDRFRGENETLDPVGGRIPGARNRFFRDNLGPDGRFKAPQELREEFAAVLPAEGPQAVVHQCGSGVSACHNLLAMDIAGLQGSRLYAGSWSEWCSDRARPVARGEPGADA